MSATLARDDSDAPFLDEELETLLREAADRSGRTCRQVLQDALCRELGIVHTAGPVKPFRVRPISSTLCPGVDPHDLAQALLDLDDAALQEQMR